MKKCPKCKEKFSEFHKYCWNDGTELKKTRVPKCKNCGKVKIGKYCSQCGLKFEEEK
jgi:predicted amidophosphoribosyltransferase